MALWSNLSAHMNYQNWKWFFSKDHNQSEEYFIVAIKQLNSCTVSLTTFNTEFLPDTGQHASSVLHRCSRRSWLPLAVSWDLDWALDLSKSLLTVGCLSGYFMHIVFSFHVPKWQRLRSTVLKYIMKPTYILFKFIAFSFISKLSVSISHSVTTIITSTEQVGFVISLESESKLSNVQYIGLSLSHVFFATSGCRYTTYCV